VHRKGRLSGAWQIDGDSARREVKLAFLLLLCLETAMAWGGRIVVQREGDAWTLQGTAERLSFGENLWTLLSQPEAPVDLTSAQVHFALAPEAARRLGRTLRVTHEPGLISAAF